MTTNYDRLQKPIYLKMNNATFDCKYFGIDCVLEIPLKDEGGTRFTLVTDYRLATKNCIDIIKQLWDKDFRMPILFNKEFGEYIQLPYEEIVSLINEER